MRSRALIYPVVVGLLSISAAVCLYATAEFYAIRQGSEFHLTPRSLLWLCTPSIVCIALWIWWTSRHFRIVGYGVSTLFLFLCGSFLGAELGAGPAGGDMDLGPELYFDLALVGCIGLSIVGFVTAVLLYLGSEKTHNKPLQPIARENARSG